MTRFNRIIAVGDIHNCYDLLRGLIEDVIRFTVDDQILILGDTIDRHAPFAKHVVLYLQSLKTRYPENIILLKGNHEEMAEAYFNLNRNSRYQERTLARSWIGNNGGQLTIQSFGNEQAAKRVLLPFISGMLPFYANETHIFVHGGIPKGYADISTVPVSELLWNRDFEWSGQKQLIVGHTPQEEVKRVGNIVLVDTGAYFTGILSGFDVLNEKVYQCVRKTVNSMPISITRG